MPLRQGCNLSQSTKKAMREQKRDVHCFGWSICSAASSPSSYSPSATHASIAKPWKSIYGGLGTRTKMHPHIFQPQMARETAAPWQTVPWAGDEGEAAKQTHHQSDLYFDHRTCDPRTGFAAVGAPRAELRSGWAERQGRDLGVSQSSRWLFRRKTKKQDKREAPWLAECEWWGSGAGGRRCASKPGAGLPGTGNSAPTVIYNPTVSVS